MDKNQLWDYIIESNIASEETLRVVTDINGFSEETLNDVLYAVTGYRGIEQLEEDEEDEEEQDNEN